MCEKRQGCAPFVMVYPISGLPTSLKEKVKDFINYLLIVGRLRPWSRSPTVAASTWCGRPPTLLPATPPSSSQLLPKSLNPRQTPPTTFPLSQYLHICCNLAYLGKDRELDFCVHFIVDKRPPSIWQILILFDMSWHIWPCKYEILSVDVFGMFESMQ